MLGGWGFAMSKAPKTSVEEPQEAIDFTLKDLKGKTHTLSDYKGKLVFLNFWATWCPPCRAEMPSMQKMYEESDKDKFVMLAVNLREPANKVEDFAQKNGYTFPILLDSSGRIGSKYRVHSIPTTFIVDQGGKLVAKISGSREWSWKDLKKLLK